MEKTRKAIDSKATRQMDGESASLNRAGDEELNRALKMSLDVKMFIEEQEKRIRYLEEQSVSHEKEIGTVAKELIQQK